MRLKVRNRGKTPARGFAPVKLIYANPLTFSRKRRPPAPWPRVLRVLIRGNL